MTRRTPPLIGAYSLPSMGLLEVFYEVAHNPPFHGSRLRAGGVSGVI